MKKKHPPGWIQYTISEHYIISFIKMVILIKFNNFILVLSKFSRPHTVLGTIFSITGIYFLSNDSFIEIFSLNLIYLILVLLVAILANIYITGLNQISDIAIDRINKPYLPLVSEELSIRDAKIIIVICFIASLVFAFAINFYLFLTIIFSLLIGSLYSLDPFRLKKYPFFASLSIITVRGFVANLGIYFAFQNLLGKNVILTDQIFYLTLFVSIFTISIALLKDIPDISGDKEHKIKTFSILFGKKTVFYIAVGILTSLYLISIIFGLIYNFQSNLFIISLLHLIILPNLIFNAYLTNYNEDKSIGHYYLTIWKVFYIEYLIIPLSFVLIQ
ncbi:MAG: Digeranylgeranylglyceryl phosphate synthase [Candidatus Heimdallarchaeota archaeon LC_3]|nr:MAG: Digeranylgeranylglyceryl phosphate synthase [Candidatus Heimdallarchaeota archaeon LC_3]